MIDILNIDFLDKQITTNPINLSLGQQQKIALEDALACCAQGMEFVWDDGSHVYPDEYPEENENVVIEGIYETYKDEGDDSLYCRLQNSTIKVVK